MGRMRRAIYYLILTEIGINATPINIDLCCRNL